MPNNKEDPSNEVTEPVNATHASDVIGGWGPIQWRILILVTLLYQVAPFSNGSIPKWAPNMDFYCHHLNETSGTFVASKNKCSYEMGGMSYKCNNFTYEMTFHRRTLTNEFDLVCDKSWFISFCGSVHQMGYAVSAILIGVISDAYGRTFAGKFAVGLEILAGFGQAFAPSIYWFFFARFFVGIAASGRFYTGLVLITEWVGPQYRAQAMGLYEYGSMVIGISSPWIFRAYADYKVTQASVSSIEIILLVLYCCFALESPHWLMMKGKYEVVEKHLTEAARAKGELDDDEIRRRIVCMKENSIKEVEEAKQRKEKREGILSVWRDPALLRVCLIIYFTNFSQSFIGYASGFNKQNLGGDMYFNGLVTGIITLFTSGFFVWVISKFQRRTFLLGTMGLEVIGIVGLLTATLLNAHYSVNVLFSFIYMTFGGMMKNTFNLYTTETFPTSMRQSNMGFCSLFSRMGSIIAPFMRELTNRTSLSFVTAIYMVLATINLCILWFLPETSDFQLPDTVAQKRKQIQSQTSVREKQDKGIELNSLPKDGAA